MGAAQPRWLDRALFGLGFALLLALSWPGVEARADDGIAPSERDLTALSPTPSAQPLPAGVSCNANAPIVDPQRAAEQRAAMQRLAEAMKAEGFEPMGNRGYAYKSEGDPAAELERVQLEANAQRARQ